MAVRNSSSCSSSREKNKKKNDNARTVLKSCFLYAIYGTATLPAAMLIRNRGIEKKYVQGFWNEELYCISSFAFSLIFFFSLASIFTLADRCYKERFAERCDTDTGIFGKIKFIFTSPTFWLEAATITALIAIFPYLSPFSEFLYAFFGNSDLSFWKRNILITVAMVPLFFLIIFFAKLSTLNWWHRMMVKKTLLKEKRKLSSVLLQIIYTSAAYLVTSATLCIVIPMFYSIFIVLRFIIVGFLATVVLAVSGFLTLKYGRAIVIRRSFMKKLKKICNSNRFKLSNVSSIYRSVIFDVKGSNFTVSTDSETYECKLICCEKKKRSLYFSESGKILKNNDILGVIKHTSYSDYSFDARQHSSREIRKILVVTPEAKDLFATDDVTDRRIYSGDSVMDYKVFQSSAFLGSLERRCL